MWQILLKKSDSMSDQNFTEALVRSSENYVGDRIINPISNGQPSQALYKALDCHISASTSAPRDFVISSFLEFFNNIGTKRTCHQPGRMSAYGTKAGMNFLAMLFHRRLCGLTSSYVGTKTSRTSLLVRLEPKLLGAIRRETGGENFENT